MPASPVALVAWREIVSRVQQKSYRIGLLVAVAIAIGAVALPALFRSGGSATSYDVALVGRSGGLATAIEATARTRHIEVRLHRSDTATATLKVKDSSWDAAVLGGRQIVARHRTDGVVALLQDAAALATTVGRLEAHGLTPEQARGALAVRPLAVHPTSSDLATQRETIAIVTVVVLFSQLITFCTWVATGVVEEKASRIVELLLSSVRPVQLLAGKLLGIGTLAAAQVAVLAAAAVLAARVAGTVTLPASELLTVLISYVAFLLGFVFFAAVAAALASTVSRQEDVSGVLAPVSVTLTLCYLASFTVATGGSSTLARVLAVVPPVSAIAMPARIARGGASAPDVLLAIALLVAVSALVLVVAARIYRASILHTGSRLRLRQAWRGEAVGATRP